MPLIPTVLYSPSPSGKRRESSELSDSSPLGGLSRSPVGTLVLQLLEKVLAFPETLISQFLPHLEQSWDILGLFKAAAGIP